MSDLEILFPKEVIIEYVRENITGDEYKISTDEKWINFNSVFSSDNQYKMGINMENNYVHSYLGGGENWSLLKFISEYHDESIEQARERLMKIALRLKKIGIKHGPIEKKIIEDCELPGIVELPEMKPFDGNLSDVGKKVLRYLLKRGITGKHIKKFNLYYSDMFKCPICLGKEYVKDECDFCHHTGFNPYYSRIIIPTYEHGNLIYFQGRSIDPDDQFRYMNPKEPRLQVVYFYDLLKENEDIYITEGPFDAMTLYDYNVTCLLNMNMSDPQILKLIKKNPKKIIFVPQFDSTKEKREKGLHTLTANINRIIKLSNEKISVGIFHWYKKYSDEEAVELKDINKAYITKIDEALITYNHKTDDVEIKQANNSVKKQKQYSHPKLDKNFVQFYIEELQKETIKRKKDDS